VLDGATILGIAPLENVCITPGLHVFRYIHPDNRNWMHPSITETLMIGKNEKIGKSVQFPALVLISTDPYGAKVLLGDSVIGTTPYVLVKSSAAAGVEMLTLSKSGYEAQTIAIPPVEGEIHFLLTRKNGGDSQNGMEREFLSTGQPKNSVPMLVSAGAAVLAGATAAYFKVKADEYYDDYRSTGSAEALDNVRKNDRVAGISLVFCQVNLFFLTYYLLSR
jgi:hypothetical protein